MPGFIFDRSEEILIAAQIIPICLKIFQRIRQRPQGQRDRDGRLDIELVKICISDLNGPASTKAQVDSVENRALASITRPDETIETR